MKFTKEDAFKQIEGYLTDNGKKDLLLSSRSVNAQLDALMPLLADDETELSVFVDKVKPTFKTMWDNLKYDNSRFAKKWLEDHPEPKEEPAPAANDASLLERLEKLEKDANERAEADKARLRKAELAKAIASKGVKDQAWVDDLLSEMSIEEGADTDSIADRCMRLYNKAKASVPPLVTPGTAGGGGREGSPFGYVSDHLKAVREASAKGTITQN